MVAPSSPTGPPGLDLAFTASLGVAAYPEHALGPERLERLADAALYLAKRAGRNRVELATANPDPVGELSADQTDGDDQVSIASNGTRAARVPVE